MGLLDGEGGLAAIGAIGVEPLEPIDLLAGVEPGVAALGGATRTLRVDDGRCGLGSLADAAAPLLAQLAVHVNRPAAAHCLKAL